ncbi:hypothetical protein SAMN05421684_8123 [Asanoa ishikariensis]|uniref:Uncharacterized protein n=1 Tax=Asanoa ishikariensis TaxID=137265 RepID=A0A1H3UUV0_9ACTN|nr:hypothetical protein [Asanoa ishikariensis]SDZ66184.1 hypothetical protein SAMN05421684_8123 [Asanoa ishikariensis]
MGGDGGPFDELPELPPDVQIPDDAAELAEEAAQVRRELREERVGGSRSGSRIFAGGGFRGSVPPDGAHTATEPASLRIPLLIMTAALLAAVISLFAAAWPNERRVLPNPASASSSGRAAPTSLTRTVPAVDLLDEAGNTVPLGSLLPAVLILADDCPCATAIAGMAPAGVAVVAVSVGKNSASPPTASAPPPTASAPPASTATLPGPVNATVRRLRDPAGGLAPLLEASTSGTATPVALVARSGEITSIVDSATPSSAYAADLALLPSR